MTEIGHGLIMCSAKEDIHSLSEKVCLWCLQMNAHRRVLWIIDRNITKAQMSSGIITLSEGEQISPDLKNRGQRKAKVSAAHSMI